MSIFNLALQNCTLSHDSCYEEVEAEQKSVKSITAIRLTVDK